MGNIDNIESYSYNDLSLIQIELLSTVPDDDVEQCWDMLRRKVNDARASLPEGVSAPIVKDDFGNVYGMFYALTGDGLSDRELSDYAELIKREVGELEGGRPDRSVWKASGVHQHLFVAGSYGKFGCKAC